MRINDVLNAEERVVFRYTLGPGRCSSLDLTCPESDDEIRNDRVFSLPTAVGDQHSPSTRLRKLRTDEIERHE